MKLTYLHPADQLVTIMNRIYENGLTTTSGGNLSVMDEAGNIWITPKDVDKGALTRNDIICVKPDGTKIGPHRPSVELPFHALVYKKRPDIRAVLHAHPPHVVSFSVVRKMPALNLISNAKYACGNVAYVPYLLPGSDILGEKIADEFAKGAHSVVMENHGLVVGGGSLFDCYLKFETLEKTAAAEIHARKLGKLTPFSEDDYASTALRDHRNMEDFVVSTHSAEECDVRRDMVRFMRRAYKQCLIGSTSGTFSARLSNGSFLITPYGTDRAYITEDDLVLVRGNAKEHGKIPSRSVKLHRLIYEKHPATNAILGAQPPHAMAFAITDAAFDSRTIPESYIHLRSVQKVSFRSVYTEPEKVADTFSTKTPLVICENNQILATAANLLRCYDRMELCEATAKSILAAKEIGDVVHITDSEVADIDRVFHYND
ncbi:MAG: class II aldolase/adducin family protein [Defluviitaleaceae bacterium]|nr:class II aldolase/adducin family protein [Defluviitaleaceae bacterium]MCL2274060.1 class II aldolase/adducin family protein [Defluviitaleaceae bacterium]